MNSRAFLLTLTPPLLAAAASAQLHLNELYISHAGTDDQEFIEIIGMPAASLSDVVLVVVESDATGNEGTVDVVIDLSGFSVPGDGYFVVGTSSVAGVDLAAGSDNLFENSSETIYLLQANDPSAVAALVGTNVATGANTTSLASQGTILDLVALHDADAGDVAYDGAPTVGPDGPFLPAGGYRGGDFPNAWCTQLFLDFDVSVNEFQPRTPGSANGACALFTDVTEISVGAGGTQTFSLDAGAAHAGELYWVVGSATGTSPGFPITGVTLPIVFDFYTNVTLSNANSGPFSNTFASLDGAGQASASVTLVGGTALALAGTRLYHSFGAIEVAGPTVVLAGNATFVDLIP